MGDADIMDYDDDLEIPERVYSPDVERVRGRFLRLMNEAKSRGYGWLPSGPCVCKDVSQRHATICPWFKPGTNEFEKLSKRSRSPLVRKTAPSEPLKKRHGPRVAVDPKRLQFRPSSATHEYPSPAEHASAADSITSSALGEKGHGHGHARDHAQVILLDDLLQHLDDDDGLKSMHLHQENTASLDNEADPSLLEDLLTIMNTTPVQKPKRPPSAKRGLGSSAIFSTSFGGSPMHHTSPPRPAISRPSTAISNASKVNGPDAAVTPSTPFPLDSSLTYSPALTSYSVNNETALPAAPVPSTINLDNPNSAVLHADPDSQRPPIISMDPSPTTTATYLLNEFSPYTSQPLTLDVSRMSNAVYSDMNQTTPRRANPNMNHTIKSMDSMDFMSMTSVSQSHADSVPGLVSRRYRKGGGAFTIRHRRLTSSPLTKSQQNVTRDMADMDMPLPESSLPFMKVRSFRGTTSHSKQRLHSSHPEGRPPLSTSMSVMNSSTLATTWSSTWSSTSKRPSSSPGFRSSSDTPNASQRPASSPGVRVTALGSGPSSATPLRAKGFRTRPGLGSPLVRHPGFPHAQSPKSQNKAPNQDVSQDSGASGASVAKGRNFVVRPMETAFLHL